MSITEQNLQGTTKLNSIEDAINDIRFGKVVVVVDDENRENEGDFIAAAEKVTPEVANEYKEWTLAVALKVANAAKEGGFMGFGGTQYSESEQALMGEIEAALGKTSV